MTNTASRTRAPFRALMLLPIAGLALSLAACGGADRPSAQQVADGMDTIFEESGASDLFTDDQLLCIAEKLVDSDISDQDLANIADGRMCRRAPTRRSS